MRTPDPAVTFARALEACEGSAGICVVPPTFLELFEALVTPEVRTIDQPEADLGPVAMKTALVDGVDVAASCVTILACWSLSTVPLAL